MRLQIRNSRRRGTVLAYSFLLIFGIQHPRTMDDGLPLRPGRQALGLLLGVVFATCFSFVPIKL